MMQLSAIAMWTHGHLVGVDAQVDGFAVPGPEAIGPVGARGGVVEPARPADRGASRVPDGRGDQPDPSADTGVDQGRPAH